MRNDIRGQENSLCQLQKWRENVPESIHSSLVWMLSQLRQEILLAVSMEKGPAGWVARIPADGCWFSHQVWLALEQL